MKSKILLMLFGLLLFSCNNEKVIGIEGKWKTTYKIYYTAYHVIQEEIYTNNEVYTCSFNGTNYLIENDNPEELLSTTAPIRIIKTYKIENDKTE